MSIEKHIKKLSKDLKLKPRKTTKKKEHKNILRKREYITHVFVEGGTRKGQVKSFIPKFEVNSYDFKPGEMVSLTIKPVMGGRG